MALIKCKECGSQVSTNAKACPSCGVKVPKRVGFIGMAVAAVLVVAMVRCSYDQSVKPAVQAPAKTPEQLAAEAARERQFQRDVLKLRALRASLKNPASFELVSVGRMADETLCVTYRGTNSFNAIVTERKPILSSGQIGEWRKHCAGKSGEDVSHIRRAL